MNSAAAEAWIGGWCMATRGSKGKDKDPAPTEGSGGMFRIYIDGAFVREVAVDGHSVRVVWDPDTKETSDADLKDKKSKDNKTGA